MIPSGSKHESGNGRRPEVMPPAGNCRLMTRRTLWILMTAGLGIYVLLLSGTTMAEDVKGPPAAVHAPDPDGSLRLDPGDHCPICGMFPARLPEYAAALQLNDNRTFYFCSNRCLVGAWRNSETYLGVPADAIKRVIVLDYFDGTPVDGRSAWWIAGSDVIGPMGPALVTLKADDQVAVFKERHGGSLVFRLDQVDAALWSKIVSPENE